MMSRRLLGGEMHGGVATSSKGQELVESAEDEQSLHWRLSWPGMAALPAVLERFCARTASSLLAGCPAEVWRHVCRTCNRTAEQSSARD
mmetsp:Transcript_127612/g.285471  ORF Transcript_127612/g.285471 Transcript_127612/m.285471 type:complete len:89 (-) Transcript_127612:39-305(-)